VISTDVLIIGSGVAGLSTAIYIAEKRKDLFITVLTKRKKDNTNTSYAQGGVAAVWNHSIDSYEKHKQDTIIAGDGLCDPEVVSFVVEEGPERVKDIMSWGTRFDTEKKSGKYKLGKEGGHSENRILHYKDLTGWEIQRALVEKAESLDNIKICEDFFAIDLITQHHLGYNVTRVTPGITCFGTYALNLDTNEIEMILAKSTVMATGGGGQVYRSTTNPVLATGDGIAMMYRAKGRLENMEFVQFHPTSLFNPEGENPSFLISEAVRGAGAILKNPDGKEFMHKYDKRLSLAPRDIVARAIDHEMKTRGEEFQCLDCTHIDKEEFINHFPTIYDKCMSMGIDPMKDMIPVVPACHYVCGGIRVDKMGRSSIDQLYAAGECTCSGLHGANRLASNSLLEGLVYGHHVALDILDNIDQLSIQDRLPEWDTKGTTDPKELILITQSWKELKDVMSYYVGIVRTDIRLKRALDRLWLLYRETDNLYRSTKLSPQLCELRNLITIGYLITRSADMRNESRGLHYNTDRDKKLPFVDLTIL
jgi:L-aspartate oxidase